MISVELIDKMGTDLSVVNAARVSYSKESNTFTIKDEKLIKYLAQHEHWSPFAHASMQFRIKAPIFVARQLVKHQVVSYGMKYPDGMWTFHLNCTSLMLGEAVLSIQNRVLMVKLNWIKHWITTWTPQ